MLSHVGVSYVVLLVIVSVFRPFNSKSHRVSWTQLEQVALLIL